MLSTTTDFPSAGSLAFRRGTAEPARIVRRNADGTALIARLRRTPGGGTTPLPGAAANCTVPLDELFEDEDHARHGSERQARQARRAHAAGGR